MSNLFSARKKSTYGKFRINDTVSGTPTTAIVAAGDVDTWIPLTDSILTGGTISDKNEFESTAVKNNITIDADAGTIEFTFPSTEERLIVFFGAANLESSNSSAVLELGLFKYVDGGAGDELLIDTKFAFSSVDRARPVADNDYFLVQGGTKFILKAKSDTAATFTFNRFNTIYTEA